MVSSWRFIALNKCVALLLIVAAIVPGASFVPIREAAPATLPLASIRQMLWPTRIEPGPASVPHSATFISATGGANAVLSSNRFKLVGASEGWFSLRGAAANRAPVYEAALPEKFSIFSQARNSTAVDRYSRVRFDQVYEGIDLVYYISGSGELQFDFLLAPGADPGQIAIDVPRNADVYLSGGAAQLRHGDASIRLAAPVAWQQHADARVPVDVRFTLNGKTLAFELGDYDPDLPLIIDPLVVTDSTFLGSNANEDTVQAMAVDPQGNIYLTGITQFDPPVNGTFPTTPGSFVDEWRQPSACAFNCLFVLKLTPSYQVSYGAFVPSTTPIAIKVTVAGEAVVVGRTLLGGDFPWTASAFSKESAGQGFILKLDAAGSELAYAATFRAKQASAVALRADGVAVIAGTSDQPGLPTTPGSLKPNHQPNGDTINEDGFVLAVSADGSSVLAGTYLGGLLNDSATEVAVDAQNRVVVGGSFRSTDMPGMPGAPLGEGDLYLARLSSDLSTVTSQRLFGGAGSDVMNALVVDPQGGYLVGGSTTSKNLPCTAGAFQNVNRGDQTGWLARVDENFASRYLSYFGGEFSDGVAALTIDPQGNAYVAGTGFSKDIPTTANGFQDVTSLGLREGYFAVIDSSGSQLTYSTYLGGEKTTPRHFDAYTGAWAVERSTDGRVYVGGSTAAASFPVSGSSLRSGMGGILDAFLVRFEDSALRITSPSLLLQARVERPYSRQLVATGGREPYTWSLAGFQLPDGLAMNSAGLISGSASNTQTEVDEYQFTVAVRDADGLVAHKSFFIGVAYPGNWVCANGVCAIDLLLGQQLVYQMPTLRDGLPPYTYTVGGTLPPGIAMAQSGSLTGAATSAGTFNATVNIADSAGAAATINLQFVVTDPNPPPPPPAPPAGGGAAGGKSSGGGGALGLELVLLALLVGFGIRAPTRKTPSSRPRNTRRTA